MKQDRFLFGILIGIVVLAVVAVGLFLTRQDSQGYLSDDTPEGVVHNFVFALQEEDYARAYGYLADQPNKPTAVEFQSALVSGYYRSRDAGLQILESRIVDNESSQQSAVVEVTVVEYNGGPFNELYRRNETVLLVLQAGEWKIQSMPHPFWQWDWYADVE